MNQAQIERLASGLAEVIIEGRLWQRITVDLTTGFKYHVNKPVTWKLRTRIKILRDYDHPQGWYSARTDGTITANLGCGYDGPSGYPDVDWMMLPSLVHDLLHWLIALGVIAEEDNDLIDEEFALIISIQMPKGWWGKTFRSFRAWYSEKATNLVNQIKGPPHRRRVINVWVPIPSPDYRQEKGA